jgi:hypothetical protein
MEMYDPAGRFFRGFADLMPTVDFLPPSRLLEAQTRAAFIDGAGSKSKEKIQQPDNTPVTPDKSLFRADYTSTEIPQLNLAVIAGGVDDKEQFLQTVTCTATDTSGNQTSCSFTVTVNDTERPTITCPADLNAAGAASCPLANTPVITYPAPMANDNCPGVTTACVPPSGSAFPLGTTTVTCTATDTSGNTPAAPCSFTVTTFSFCLQDETSPGNLVFVNALTGDFFFCCGGVPIATGRGTLTVRSCVGSIDTGKGDRQIHIRWDTAANNGLGAGTGYVQKRSSRMVCQITDRNMSNNTCQCSSSPPASPKKPPTAQAP